MINDDFAEINDDECIRCGTCHDVCPQEAVRHDGERIPLEITANLRWVLRLLEHYKETSDRAAFMNRIERFFNGKKKVIEQTIALIKDAKEDPEKIINAAINSLSEPRNRKGK